MAATGDHAGAADHDGHPQRREAGTVTAELAVGLPGVVAMVLLVIGVMGAGTVYVECHEAARVGVRQVMLEASAEAGELAARRVAGDRAQVHVTIDGAWASVTVTKTVTGWLPLTLSAQLSGPLEGAGP